VQTHGREKLPGLLDGFHTHDSWETLIPAVTGVCAEQFESGWQEFVTEWFENLDQEK